MMINNNLESALFAMGCFWCAESAFRDHTSNAPLAGISSIIVGYAGGLLANPTYENHTGHREAIKLEFDPSIINYEQILEIFWRNIDPFDAHGQFCDKGFAYTTAIYYFTLEQQELATATKNQIQAQATDPIVTVILPATSFYPAENYHQNYSAKSPQSYNWYACNSGRGTRLREIWGSQE